ncbi:MAG: ATP-binding domain-containing protein [Sulfuritalea sp.]|nr:ATP-binding domain-containing protein [Sulfuritalea sp.]
MLVKFGYSVTCHKAQGGEWDSVYVKFSGFPERNSGFFRWAYTAITRGRKTLGVIEAPSFGEPTLQISNNDLHSEDGQQTGNRLDLDSNECEGRYQGARILRRAK